MAASAVAIEFDQYDDDVAALLREYQGESDQQGSYNPQYSLSTKLLTQKRWSTLRKASFWSLLLLLKVSSNQ